ncbi:TonB family protein [archaeon]|nr:TonB family protein [archaeon]
MRQRAWSSLHPIPPWPASLEGIVVLSFVILPDGGIKDVRMTHSSGGRLFDRNVVDARDLHTCRILPEIVPLTGLS